MVKFLSLISLAVFAALPLKAAVSGYYDSLEQINTILRNQKVADVLRQAPIVSLAQSGDAGESVQWLVQSEGCKLTVSLIAVMPPGGIGKRTYEVSRIGKCKK